MQKHVVDHREQINEVAQSLISNGIMVAVVERDAKALNQRADEVAVQVSKGGGRKESWREGKKTGRLIRRDEGGMGVKKEVRVSKAREGGKSRK